MTLHFISYTSALGLARSWTGSATQVPAIQFPNTQNLCLHRSITFMMLYLQGETEKTRRQKADKCSGTLRVSSFWVLFRNTEERMSENSRYMVHTDGRYKMCTQELLLPLLLQKLFKMVTCISAELQQLNTNPYILLLLLEKTHLKELVELCGKEKGFLTTTSGISTAICIFPQILQHKVIKQSG